MIRKRTLLIPVVSVIALYAAFTFGYNLHQPTHSDPPKPTEQTQLESPDDYGLWILTNKQRADAKKPLLALDPLLTASAIDKCADMIQHKYWDHAAPNGGLTYKDFILNRVPNAGYAGENLSLRGNTSDKVIDAWMKSPGHRANILNENYKRVGFAVCTNAKSEIMVVQHFAD